MHSCRIIGLVTSAFFLLTDSSGAMSERSQVRLQRPIYNTDSEHLWNRLHAALFNRVGPNQRIYGHDRLEPLLWRGSKHLLEQHSHTRAVDTLMEFIDDNGEKLIADPMKRAILQRDLWLVFNWLEGPHTGFTGKSLRAEDLSQAQRRLRLLLAAAIARLALTPDEIRSLPSNYSAAVAAGTFARHFDSRSPPQQYLPANLFSETGPWMCVGRSDGVTAPRHLREDGVNQFTNSVFIVFMKLPAGRAASSDYLERLMRFKQPLLVKNPRNDRERRYPFVPNPELPQLPGGVEFALVRQALLISTSNRPVMSPITESIQLRVIHGDVQTVTKQVRERPSRFFSGVRQRSGTWQSFQEFRLSRTDLFSSPTIGLRAIGLEERDFKTGFGAHQWDEFERPLRPDQSFLAMAQQQAITSRCIACHNMPGVYSFNSYTIELRFAMRRKNGAEARPFPLSELSVSEVAQSAIHWKENRPNWKTLRSLLPDKKR